MRWQAAIAQGWGNPRGALDTVGTRMSHRGSPIRLAQIVYALCLFREAPRLARESFGWNDRDVIIAVSPGWSLSTALRVQARELELDGRVQFLGARSDIPAVLASYDLFAVVERRSPTIDS